VVESVCAARVTEATKENKVSTSDNRAGFWTSDVWTSIDEGVTTSIGAIRVAQNVFPASPLPNTTSVPADIFDHRNMTIAEGEMLPFAELAVEFSLTNGQVNDDPTGSTAITLSKLAAKSLALAEDIIILQGMNVDLPQGVRIESGEKAIGHGLLGLVNEQAIIVQPPDQGAPTNSGGEILAAIARGIALLTKHGQAKPYALIEDTKAWAATWGSVINGEPAYCILNQVLTGGIYGTGAMPPDTGLLVALGGDPTTIYVGTDAVTEPTQQERSGLYSFREFERIQVVARDPRAFVKLDFPYLSDSGHEEAGREAGG
jgi:uncharacterized linocin/CFP29 family protein